MSTMQYTRVLNSPAGVDRLARDLAGVLRPGDRVALVGPLGAGKTTLVRHLASVLRCDMRQVASPTFVLVHQYERPDAPPLVHIDACRMDESEIDTLGLDALDEGAIVLIEWADRVPELVGEDALRIELEHVDEGSRRAHIRVPASWEARQGLPALEAPPATICPITGKRVEGDSPTWPFFDERARLADLGRWLSESYQISRPIDQQDIEQSD